MNISEFLGEDLTRMWYREVELKRQKMPDYMIKCILEDEYGSKKYREYRKALAKYDKFWKKKDYKVSRIASEHRQVQLEYMRRLRRYEQV